MKTWCSEQWFTERVRQLMTVSELEKDTALTLARDVTSAGELVAGGWYEWVPRHRVPEMLAYNPEDVWALHLTLVSEEPDGPCQHELGQTTTTRGVKYKLSRCPRCLAGCVGKPVDPGSWELGCCLET
jgi:hypothetical protein